VTVDRQLTLFYWAMTGVACLVFLGTVVETDLAARSLDVSGVDLGQLSTVFLGIYCAGAPMFCFLLGAALLEAKTKEITDGSRPAPRLRSANFEPPRRRVP